MPATKLSPVERWVLDKLTETGPVDVGFMVRTLVENQPVELGREFLELMLARRLLWSQKKGDRNLIGASITGSAHNAGLGHPDKTAERRLRDRGR